MQGDLEVLNNLKERRRALIQEIGRVQEAVEHINAVIALLLESTDGDMTIEEVEESNRRVAGKQDK